MEEADFVTAPVAVLVESPPTRNSIELVQDICECYLNAIERGKQRERTISMDEMTGIQAEEAQGARTANASRQTGTPRGASTFATALKPPRSAWISRIQAERGGFALIASA